MERHRILVKTQSASALLAFSTALLFSISLSGQIQQPISNGACDGDFTQVGGITRSPTRAMDLTEAVCFAQVSFTDPRDPEMYSRYGHAFISSGILDRSGYLNVERYADGQPAGWIVKNLPVSGSSPGFSPIFDLGESGRRSSISAYVDFTLSPLPDDSFLKNRVPLIYPLDQVQHIASAPSPAPNPNSFADVVCYESDANFWAGQASVAVVATRVEKGGDVGFQFGTGWIIKGKDPSAILFITAAHNFRDDQIADVTITFNFQRPECGKGNPQAEWTAQVEKVLERSPIDYMVVSLKGKPEKKQYPAPLQALYKDSKAGDLVTIPQHPGGFFKQGGYYYDLANKKRCYVTDSAVTLNSKCGVVKGTSGSPVLDATQIGATPYAIALVVRGGSLSPAAIKMSEVCDLDAKGKKLLDCK